MDDPVARARGLVVERDHPGFGRARMAGPTPRLSRTPARPGRPVGPPGRHPGRARRARLRRRRLFARDIARDGLPQGTTFVGMFRDRSGHLPVGRPDGRTRRTAGGDHRRPGCRTAPRNRDAPPLPRHPLATAVGTPGTRGGHRLRDAPLGGGEVPNPGLESTGTVETPAASRPATGRARTSWPTGCWRRQAGRRCPRRPVRTAAAGRVACVRTAGAGGQHRQPRRGDGATRRPAARQAAHRVRLRLLHTPLQDKQAALTWLWGALVAGTLRIDIRTFTLGELGAAWTEQAASPHAKCVVLADGAVPARSPSTPIRDDRSNRS